MGFPALAARRSTSDGCEVQQQSFPCASRNSFCLPSFGARTVTGFTGARAAVECGVDAPGDLLATWQTDVSGPHAMNSSKTATVPEFRIRSIALPAILVMK